MSRICDNVACILLRHAIRAVLFNIRFYFILELQSSATVTKLDRIRNERIRSTMKMGEISKKVQESGLKWYWNVMRREEYYVGRLVMAREKERKG